MRKALIGLLLAATAAAPALADKGGRGHGGGHGGGPKAAHQVRHGNGGGHEFRGRQDFRQQARASAERPQIRVQRADFASRGKDKARPQRMARPERAFAQARVQRQPAFREESKRKDWRREAHFERPARLARFDDKHARKAWKREAKEERHFQRAVAKQERFRPAERWARATPVVRYDREPVYYRPAYERPVVRYARPAVRYVAPSVVRYAPAYAPLYYPAQSWSGDDWWPQDDYGYSSYGYDPAPYAYDDGGYGYYGTGRGLYDSASPSYGTGLFGGSDGLMAALIPVLLQSVLGGDVGLGDLGGLGGLGALTGYDGGINVLPLQQASYAPYLSNGSDLGSLLVPAVLSNSFF